MTNTHFGIQYLLPVAEFLIIYFNVIKSISSTRGPKDVAPLHLLVIFENQNGFEM